jgi:hypothetical protein
MEKQKVDWRNFLMPDWKKSVLFLVLFGFFSSFIGNPYMSALCDPCGCPTSWGYPLSFYNEQVISASMKPLNCGEIMPLYNYFSLIIDIVIWYLVSCFIVWIKQRKKKK